MFLSDEVEFAFPIDKSFLLFPLTNSVCRIFSFLLDCAFAANSGFTNIRSRIILRKIPALVKPADIIMTSRHHTCRNNSFGRAVAKRFTLNEVNASRIALLILKNISERIPWNRQTFYFSSLKYSHSISSSKSLFS